MPKEKSVSGLKPGPYRSSTDQFAGSAGRRPLTRSSPNWKGATSRGVEFFREMDEILISISKRKTLSLHFKEPFELIEGFQHSRPRETRKRKLRGQAELRDTRRQITQNVEGLKRRRKRPKLTVVKNSRKRRRLEKHLCNVDQGPLF